MPFAKVRACSRCNTEFTATHPRQNFCGRDVVVTCAVCGKEFNSVCSSKMPSTCSPECTNKYIKQRQIESASKIKRICKWCGKEFIPKSSRDLYCSDTHYSKCVICGKEFVVTRFKDDTAHTCSKECRYIYATQQRDLEAEQAHLKEALMKKYGVDNVAKIPGSIEKAKATMLEKYGTEWYTQTEEYKERIKETSLEKYGAEHHLASPEIKDKRTKTIQEKYGVDNVFQSEEVKQEIKDTLVDKYGVEYITQVPEIRDKILNTNLSKYGVSHAMKLQEFKDKAAQTSFKRYGRLVVTQTHIEDIETWYEFIADPRKFITERYAEPPKAQELAKFFGVDVTTIDDYLHKTDSIDCIKRVKSSMEDEVYELIRTCRPDLEIITNTRKVISPLELDIYIPKLKLAFECNPTITHNSTTGMTWLGTKPKSKHYHYDKSVACVEQGVFLFHIFGYEWKYRHSIIISMIKNLIDANSEKIYARKCVVKEVPVNVANDFLELNHRQGNTVSKIRLGLYYNDELVSLMTFGKMRSTMGTDNSDLTDCWELSRFCSKLNTTVIGGASKLFKHFCKNYNPNRIRSFSDNSHTKGNLYLDLGFDRIRVSKPSYVWVNAKTDQAYHRMNAQKRNIKRFLGDDNIDLSETEVQIMSAHGFVQVYDSGTSLWEWKKS